MDRERKNTDFFDVRELLQRYAAKWYWFVISVIICGGLAFVYSRISKPLYGVRANIMISTGDESSLAVFGSLSNVLGNSAYVDDEIFVLSAHSVYKDVAKEMGLEKQHIVNKGFLNNQFEYKNYPVELYTPAGICDTLSTALSFKIKVDSDEKVDVEVKAKRNVIAEEEDMTFPVTLETAYGKFVVNKTEHFPKGEKIKTYITLTSYDGAAEQLDKSVVCDIRSRKSNVINLSYDTPYPEFGMLILNNIMNVYNQRGISEKNQQGERTAEFIDERLALLSSDLNVAEGEIQEYKEREGFFDLQSEVEFQSKMKGELEGELIKAETELEILRMIRSFISDPANSQTLIPLTTNNEGLRNAISTYNELLMKRMDLANNARPNNTTLRMLDDQIAAMRQNINISLDKAYETQTIAVNELKSARNTADAKLGNIPTKERNFRDLLRQQAIKQQLYVYLLQRREETALMLANAVPKGQIIDEAYKLVDPLSMDRKVLWLIGIIIGLLIPPVIFWLKDFFNDKFDSVTSLKRLTDVPIVGEMCVDRTGRQLVVTESESSSSAELFRLMRTNLQFILGSKDDKVVLVTSTKPGEGKSYISVNLAAVLAMMEHKKVLLVGLDIRKPRLASYLGINPPYGLTQYLASDSIPFEKLITKSESINSLDIIVAGPIPPNPAEMLQSDKLDKFFEYVREHYDYIVVDTAPVGMVSDTFTLDRFADATIYVTRANFTKKRDIEFINEIYDQRRLKKLSVVLNGTQIRRGYGYGYSSDEKGRRD